MKDNLSVYAIALSAVFVLSAFIAPFYWDQWYAWTIALMCLIGILACIGRRFVVSSTDTVLLICFVCLCGGLINILAMDQAMRYFRLFILPIPFIYFFSGRCFAHTNKVDILWALFICGVAAGIWGIVEFVTGSNILYRRHIPNMYYGVFIGKRLMSCFMHPVVAATFFCAVFFPAVSLFSLQKNRLIRIVISFGIAVIGIALLLTFSRGSLLACLIAVSLYVFFVVPHKAGRWFLGTLAGIVALISLSSLLWRFFWPLKRMSVEGLFMPMNFLRKFDRLQMCLRMLQDHPWFGIGYDHFRALFHHYTRGLAADSMNVLPDGKVADCMFLTIAAETGIIGITGFVLFVIVLLRCAMRGIAATGRGDDRIIRAGFLAGWVSIMCMFLTYDTLYWSAPMLLFWAYSGIIAFYCIPKEKLP